MKNPALVVGLCLACLLPSSLFAQEQEEPQETYMDVIDVTLQTVRVRVVDRRGNPLLDLKPEELRVMVGGEPVAIDAMDWHSNGSENRTAEEVSQDFSGESTRNTHLDSLPRLAEPPPEPPGRLFVLFVQIGHHMVVSLEEAYITGHLKVLPHISRWVESLEPEDHVAIVSFDSRMEPWLDFTLDRELTIKTLKRSIGFGNPELRRNAGTGPSLFAHLDIEAARRATSAEEALLLLARALRPLEGPKDIVFIGWAAGRFVMGSGVHMTGDFPQAIHELNQAEASVFVLDVMQGGHPLAAGLVTLAANTGGTYSSTYEFLPRKVKALARTLSGYYVLSLDQKTFPRDGGRLRIQLLRDEARVLYRPIIFGPRR